MCVTLAGLQAGVVDLSVPCLTHFRAALKENGYFSKKWLDINTELAVHISSAFESERLNYGLYASGTIWSDKHFLSCFVMFCTCIAHLSIRSQKKDCGLGWR